MNWKEPALIWSRGWGIPRKTSTQLVLRSRFESSTSLSEPKAWPLHQSAHLNDARASSPTNSFFFSFRYLLTCNRFGLEIEWNGAKLMFIGKLFRQSHQVSLFVHSNCSHFSPLSRCCSWCVLTLIELSHQGSIVFVRSVRRSQALPYTRTRTGLLDSCLSLRQMPRACTNRHVSCVVPGVRNSNEVFKLKLWNLSGVRY
jgi:hypothetical protein